MRLLSIPWGIESLTPEPDLSRRTNSSCPHFLLPKVVSCKCLTSSLSDGKDHITRRDCTVRLATFPSIETLLVVEVLARRGRSRALKALPSIRDNPFSSYPPSVSKQDRHPSSPVSCSSILLPSGYRVDLSSARRDSLLKRCHSLRRGRSDIRSLKRYL